MNTTRTPTPCWLMDIDGTVADLAHRRHHVVAKPKNWPAFHAECLWDRPINHMRALVQSLAQSTTIVYMSGRNEAHRNDTSWWLNNHGFPFFGRLYMRADGDFRDDSIVKLELLQKLRADGFEPIMAFDDRDRVVKMWRDNGVPCAQVAPGDF